MNRRRQWMSGLRAAGVAALLVLSGTARTTGPNASAQGGGCLTNAIVCENQNTGSPSSEWDIVGSGDANIQGFATEMSVNRGATVRFKVKTDATAYQMTDKANVVLTLRDNITSQYIWSESFELKLENWFEAQLDCR